MRNKACTIILATTLTVLTACTSDSYDKGNGANSLMVADFVEAYTNSDRTVSTVETDDGTRYSLTHNVSCSWIEKGDTTYRAALYYNKVSDNAAEPVALAQIPVLRLLEPKEGATIKTDPITFESIWTSENGKYLNIGLYLKVGQTDNDEALHVISMICEGLKANDDNTTTACLRLYHDQNNVPEYYSSKYYVSLSLSDLRQLNADSVRIAINTYDGDLTRTISIPR